MEKGKGAHLPRIIVLTLFMSILFGLTACSGNGAPASSSAGSKQETEQEVETEKTAQPEGLVDAGDVEVQKEAQILVAAAASLEYSYVGELTPLFQEKYS